MSIPRTYGVNVADDTGDALTQLLEQMRQLHIAAGMPAYLAMSRETGVGRATIHSAIRGPKMINFRTFVKVVDHLCRLTGKESEPYLEQWRTARIEVAIQQARVNSHDRGGSAFLVVDDQGRMHGAVTGDSQVATERARKLGGMVVRLPIIADFRNKR